MAEKKNMEGKYLKKKNFEEEKKNREGKGTKQFVRNRQQRQNKSRTKKKQNTVIYFAHLDKKLELHTTLQDSE